MIIDVVFQPLHPLFELDDRLAEVFAHLGELAAKEQHAEHENDQELGWPQPEDREQTGIGKHGILARKRVRSAGPGHRRLMTSLLEVYQPKSGLHKQKGRVPPLSSGLPDAQTTSNSQAACCKLLKFKARRCDDRQICFNGGLFNSILPPARRKEREMKSPQVCWPMRQLRKSPRRSPLLANSKSTGQPGIIVADRVCQSGYDVRSRPGWPTHAMAPPAA